MSLCLCQSSAVDTSDYVGRPMNSFMLFSQEQRRLLHRQHGHVDNRTVSKLLGDKWAKLSDNEKRVYADRASQVLV